MQFRCSTGPVICGTREKKGAQQHHDVLWRNKTIRGADFFRATLNILYVYLINFSTFFRIGYISSPVYHNERPTLFTT